MHALCGMPIGPRAPVVTKLKIIIVEIVREIHLFKGLFRFGSDLLSHALRRSTIGAKALNGRVRDGTGCFALAMTTKPKKSSELHHLSMVTKSNTLRCVCFGYQFGQICLLLDQIKPIGQLVPVN